CGELKFNFLLTRDVAHLPFLARQLEQPPIAILVRPHPGKLARTGSLASLEPASLQLLALKPAEDGDRLILRAQETAGRATAPKLTLFGQRVTVPKILPHRIATFRLTRRGKTWRPRAGDIIEST